MLFRSVGSVSIGEKLAYALRKDLTWGEVKSELPVAATYKDTTKKFTGWSPALQSDSEKVKEATYVAQYAAEPDIIDVTDPSMPTPGTEPKSCVDTKIKCPSFLSSRKRSIIRHILAGHPEKAISFAFTKQECLDWERDCLAGISDKQISNKEMCKIDWRSPVFGE